MNFDTATIFLAATLLCPVLPLVAQESQSALDTPARLAQAKQAAQANAEKLRSAFATGKLRHYRYRRDSEVPTVTLEAELVLYYDAPKFQLQLQYVTRMQEIVAPVDERSSDSVPSESAGLAAQTILFDGKTVTTLEREQNGVCRGDIYFDFHKQNMLRMAGFPFEDPVALWREPLQIERTDLRDAITTPLVGGGFMGILDKETYRLKFYFLNRFDYDLRRVCSYRIGEGVPFRDWHLSWEKSQEVYYVNRLVRRIQEAGEPASPGAPAAVTGEQIELEYSTFQLNLPIQADRFQISSLSIPEQTPFYDHRVNVNGKPQSLVWVQGALIPTTP